MVLPLKIITSFNYVVGLTVHNTLCWTGAYMRNQDSKSVALAILIVQQRCHTCSVILKGKWHMTKESILVRTLTTDGDEKAHLGMSNFYNKLGSAWKVARQAAPHHLGSRQIRRARASNWITTLFQGKRLSSKAKQQATVFFAKNLARCGAIIKKLRLKENGVKGNLNTVEPHWSVTLETVTSVPMTR
jgi:hypothetical protein